MSAQEIEDNLKSEITLMTNLDHPNIVKMFGALEDGDSRVVYMIMEYCENGSFLSESHFKSIKVDKNTKLEYSPTLGQSHRWKMSFKQAKRYSVDLISGLIYSKWLLT